MEAHNLDACIAHLGRHLNELIMQRLIPGVLSHPLVRGADDLERISRPEPGMAFHFYTEQLELQQILISLEPNASGEPAYTGDLPQPLALNMDKAYIRTALGSPEQSQESWDRYKMARQGHPNTRMTLRYASSGSVRSVEFDQPDLSD